MANIHDTLQESYLLAVETTEDFATAEQIFPQAQALALAEQTKTAHKKR